ncbi:hypothetical protein Nekkels1_20 [Cellulophaga phage Nekkels_1]|uniref:Uncharacterized protein n=1 Tax=Cellulophaga phage Nekkels_1 TaxID=2745692 RepID=A0A8E4XZL8_9CAUD|nr:hypothetical protein M1M31_gp20 [Cellulophaga phage Nekkels_1]QQO97020.1 hypothetical protein Nekkels1_20 [Cellulophaga phage Nekkels_1]QQO97113.1 hypothetical protein Nekkels2_20 [Cellulophaga phage Nekkels_2]
MKKQVIILSTDSGDWEGMYINGKLIDEGHTLGEGNNKIYLLEQSEIHGFNSGDVEFKELTESDSENVANYGCMLDSISDYIDAYTS